MFFGFFNYSKFKNINYNIGILFIKNIKNFVDMSNLKQCADILKDSIDIVELDLEAEHS